VYVDDIIGAEDKVSEAIQESGFTFSNPPKPVNDEDYLGVKVIKKEDGYRLSTHQYISKKLKLPKWNAKDPTTPLPLRH